MNTEPAALTGRKPDWFRPPQDGKALVATRVSLSRNLGGIIFPPRASEMTLANVETLLRHRLEELGNPAFDAYFPVPSADSLAAALLGERLLLPHRVLSGPSRGVAVSPGETVSAAVNILDHLTLVVMEAGFRPDRVWERADEIDDRLAGAVEFAFDPDFGFLTVSPEDVGTGLHIEFVAHLPALVLTSQMDKAARALSEIGFQILPLAEDGAGHLFRVRSARTFGPDEGETIADVLETAPVVENYELAARDSLSSPAKRIVFEDRVARAVALLDNARLMSASEALDALSLVGLGASFGLAPARAAALLFDLYFDLLPAHLRLSAGRETDDTERKRLRADMVKRAWTGLTGDRPEE